MALTIPEAARHLGKDPETLRRWIRAGRLPATRMGTQYFIENSDLPAQEDVIPRPAWLRRTMTGEPMPDVVAILRRQRSER